MSASCSTARQHAVAVKTITRTKERFILRADIQAADDTHIRMRQSFAGCLARFRRHSVGRRPLAGVDALIFFSEFRSGYHSAYLREVNGSEISTTYIL